MDRHIARANIGHYLGLLNNNDLPPKTRETVVNLLIEEVNKLKTAMERTNSRVLSVEGQIKNQIELVAKLICEGEPALGAMQVLDSLTRKLIAEEDRLSCDRKM